MARMLIHALAAHIFLTTRRALKSAHGSEMGPTLLHARGGRGATAIAYNRSGFPVSAKNPLGMSAEICYNAFNLPVKVTDADGIVTEYTYNDFGLVERVARKDGAETLSSLAVSYDGAGRPVSYTDQDGLSKSFERDEFGKVLKERFPDGSEVGYSYDALGRRTSVIDENGHEIRFGWGRFGLESRTTAAGQLTDYVRDDLGLVKEVVSKWNGSEDRRISSERDEFGRLVRADYGNGEVETFAYDKWNRLAKHTRGNISETYKYDHFGRLVEKRENGITTSYSYDAWGNRIWRETKDRKGEVISRETRAYDRLGRLVETSAGFGSVVKYSYDRRGRLARQTVDGTPIDYEYTKYGQLSGKYLGGKVNPDASVTYEYSKSGQIVARTANGVRQTYEYDKKGQLLAVKDDAGNAVESYAYDKAGNMLRKSILRSGRAGAPRTPQSTDYFTTPFTFDAANQLVSSTTDGMTTRYSYDAAGRLVREGSKTYRYGYLDKVMSVTDNGSTYTYEYHADGQLAKAMYGDGRALSPRAPQSEDFLWDGLALIQRGDEQFINEPHIGGGNPVASSKGTSYFNDALGTTVGAKKDGKYSAAVLTAFGENHLTTKPHNHQTFFTGKPLVEGLGHAFWMRNYRAGLAKWQTADPMGYPDGWNQLAYCNNAATTAVDLWGCETVILDGPHKLTDASWKGWGPYSSESGVAALFRVYAFGMCNHDYKNLSISSCGIGVCEGCSTSLAGYQYDGNDNSLKERQGRLEFTFEKTGSFERQWSVGRTKYVETSIMANMTLKFIYIDYIEVNENGKSVVKEQEQNVVLKSAQHVFKLSCNVTE